MVVWAWISALRYRGTKHFSLLMPKMGGDERANENCWQCNVETFSSVGLLWTNVPIWV